MNAQATRLMTAYYQVGQDQNYPPLNFAYTTDTSYIGKQLVNKHVNVQSNHYSLIREIGSASIVMLKNLNKSTSRACVILVIELNIWLQLYLLHFRK